MDEVRWAVLLPDFGITAGRGKEPGLRDLFAQAEGVMFSSPGLPPIYVAGGLGVMWTTDRDWGTDQLVQRFWGIAPLADARFWLFPEGNMIGVGDSLEAVLKIRDKFLAASR